VRCDEGGVDVEDQWCTGVDLVVGGTVAGQPPRRRRACARAVWIARNATVGSVASRSTVRDTVGSDATSP
jgi:hypothetical protein